MRVLKGFFIIAALFVCGVLSLFAPEDTVTAGVTISEICSIGFNNASTITLSITDPAMPGLTVTGDTDSFKLLQYSSLVTYGHTRTVTANWDPADSAPPGTSLSLEAADIPAGCGSTAGEITLSDTARTIITNIGGCHTGTGVNGVTLVYSFNIIDVSLLETESGATVTVTFTLTDSV
ncbi:MAG: hypothetical protein JW881_10500 [Spirochaetales bacterium]|nr:hypothetical protein [Spirochaetales bacterium]